MTDSYHFASVPQFRVGGVYRNRAGRIVELSLRSYFGHEMSVLGKVYANVVNNERATIDGAGIVHLLDGRFGSGESLMDAMPGELHQVNGEWVPVEQKLSFPSGSVLTTSGDKIVGREEPAYIKFTCVDCLGCAKCGVDSEPAPNAGMKRRDVRLRTERETIFAVKAAMRASELAAAKAAEGAPLRANANLLKTA